MTMRLVVLFLALTASQAFAQEATPPTYAEADVDANELDQAARILFESASRAYEAGNFTDALARYTNAYELSNRAPLLYNIAICHDRLEQKEQAATYYERFVAEVPSSARAPIARSRAEILRASLETENAQETAGPEVNVESNEERHGPEVMREPESRSLGGPIAMFAVGGAGLVTFVVGALLSSSRLSDAENLCMSGRCNEADLDAVDTASLVADIGLGVAVAGTAAGVIWLLVGGDDPDESSARVSPVASPNALGAQVSGSF